jgi:phage baseplate assembly protein W
MSSKNLSESNFLGTGWGFPPAFNIHKKSVEMISGEEDIMSSLEILFTTKIGERIMRSRYGSQVPAMIFEPMDSNQRVVLRENISDAIRLYEPRIKPLDVRVEMDYLEGKVTISVDFSVITTNNRRNFVYPFYIIEGTEVRK